MMMKLHAYARLILFVGGVLFGIQIPGFLDAYGKSLESHFRESVRSLAVFQQDADRYFEGDLGRLIGHYGKAGDPVFRDGGRNIAAIRERKMLLEKALADFRKSRFSAVFHVLLRPVQDVRREVAETYTHIIRLDMGAISVGLFSGVVAALLPEILVYAVRTLWIFFLKALRRKTGFPEKR